MVAGRRRSSSESSIETEHDDILPGRPSDVGQHMSPLSAAPPPDTKKDVSWKDLPRKDQLVILIMARLSEPLVQTSLQAYMFYQLKWFNPDNSDSTISTQAGILHASFMAAQFTTSMMWGRIADSSRFGRKMVLFTGLVGTALSCVGFAFATSFWQALLFRILGGITNGNVGTIRTMVSETIREKRFQSRAFLLIPMTANVGITIGPILGGLLSDLASSYPSTFGSIGFFKAFPYAAPNLFSAGFLFFAACAVWLGLEETLDSRQGLPDRGIQVGKRLANFVRRITKRGHHTDIEYSPLASHDVELVDENTAPKKPAKRYTQKLPFRRIFTRNFVITLLVHFLVTFHLGTFNSLWFVFLSTPVHDPAKSSLTTRLPFQFTGGLGMQPQEVGFAMAVIGFLGIIMQVFLYPGVAARYNIVSLWRWAMPLYPVVYFLVPYLSIVPGDQAPPAAKTGLLIWMTLATVLTIHVVARTFSIPSHILIVNNSSPHPSVLATVHGIAQTVGSASRTLGPMVGGVVYGYGLNEGIVGLVFWILSIVAVITFIGSVFVKEGNGHEIVLEGDDIQE